MGLSNSFVNWLWPSERRRAKRKEALPLAAFYWDGSEPKPRQVKNVSPDGMYLLTDERWYPNTMLQMTLVRSDRREGDPGYSLRLAARVIRSGHDGVGFAFVLRPNGAKHATGVFETQATRADLKSFLAGMHQAITEDTCQDWVNSLVPRPLMLSASGIGRRG